MAAPCGAIIYYLATVTGLTSLATYYGLTSNAPAQAELPLSAHIGTVIATKTVEAVLNTFAPTVHHTLRIDAPPPPALSVILYPIKPKFSAPATFVLSSGETIVSSGSAFASSHTPFSSLPQLLGGLLCILMSLMLLYVCADFCFALRERTLEIIAARLADRSSYYHDEAEQLRIAESKRVKRERFNERLNHDIKMAALRKQNSAAEEKINTDHSTKMNKLNDEYSEEQRNHATKMAELRKANEDEYSTEKRNHDTRMAGLRKGNSVEEDKINLDHSTEMNNAKDAHSAEMDRLNSDNSIEINNIKDAHSTKVSKLLNDNSIETEKLQDEHLEEKRNHNMKIVELRKQNSTQEDSTQEDKPNMDHPINIGNVKDAHSEEKVGLRNDISNDSSAEIRPLSPNAATFTLVAEPSATAPSIGSTSQVSETETIHEDTNKHQSTGSSEDKPPRVGTAALVGDIETLARSLSRSSSKSVNRPEISKVNESSNRFSVLSIDQSEVDEAAPTDITAGGDAPLGHNGITDNDIDETSQRLIDAPAGSADTKAAIEDSGWEEAKPKKSTRRGNRAGRAVKEKRERYQAQLAGGGQG